MFLLGPCAKTPHTVFIYGENHSDAGREDKTARSETTRVGKPCDFIFWSSDREAGVGENTGPKYKDHHEKTKNDFIDVIKVAKAQHIRFQTLMVEYSGMSPLPKSLQEALALITIPFFHVVGTRIRFYILFQVNGDLFGIWEWAAEDLPTTDLGVGDIILLCKRFFAHQNLVDRVGRTVNIINKKAKIFRDLTRIYKEFTCCYWELSKSLTSFFWESEIGLASPSLSEALWQYNKSFNFEL